MQEYVNIREYLGGLIGQRLVDISQHDEEEWERDKTSYICLIFEDGSSVKFHVEEHAMDLDGPIAEGVTDVDGL